MSTETGVDSENIGSPVTHSKSADPVEIVMAPFPRPWDQAIIDRARELIRHTGSEEMMKSFEVGLQMERYQPYNAWVQDRLATVNGETIFKDSELTVRSVGEKLLHGDAASDLTPQDLEYAPRYTALNPRMDRHGYPSDLFLAWLKIERDPVLALQEAAEYCIECSWGDAAIEDGYLKILTGGWSGCEDVIGTLLDNPAVKSVWEPTPLCAHNFFVGDGVTL